MDVSEGSGADLDGRGTGCVAADFDRDGRTDLYVTGADAGRCCGTGATAGSTRAPRTRGRRRSAGTPARPGRRRRQRLARPVRRRLRQHRQPGGGGDAGLPQHLHRGAGPALPEPGPGRRRRDLLPGGGPGGGPGGRQLRLRPRRSVLRPGGRRRPRPVRGQRHPARPPLRQRAVAGRRGGRTRGHRVPLRGVGRPRRRGRPGRGHGGGRGRLRRRRPRRPVRDQRPGPGPRRVPRPGVRAGEPVVRRRATDARARPGRLHRLGRGVGRPRPRQRPRPGGGQRGHPGHRPGGRRRAVPGLRPGRAALRRRGGGRRPGRRRSAAGPGQRGGRLRQRRRPRRGGDHGGRAAGPAPEPGRQPATGWRSTWAVWSPARW